MNNKICLHKIAVFNDYVSVIEWVGPKIDDRHVKVVFDKDRKKIHVNDLRRKPLRMLDFRRMEGSSTEVHLRLSTDHESNMLSLRLAGEIDLVRCIDILYPTSYMYKN